MKMDSPVGPNALDAQGVVGRPIDRVDGRLKVSGGARYAYEMQQTNVLYGFVVEASIGKGTIKLIDTRTAKKAPGVVLVLTYRNAPAQGTGNHRIARFNEKGEETLRSFFLSTPAEPCEVRVRPRPSRGKGRGSSFASGTYAVRGSQGELPIEHAVTRGAGRAVVVLESDRARHLGGLERALRI